MPSMRRATLPSEYFDYWSARLLLEPEPQYLHGMLFKMAFNASLEDADEALGLLGRPGFGMGGTPYQTDEKVGRLALSDGLYDRAIEVVPEIGKKLGQNILINRPVFTDSTYTEASREVPPGTTIRTTPQAVEGAQVSMLVKRYAGPYNNTAAAVTPLGIEKFDTDFMKHRPAQIKGLHLKRDCDKTLDSFTRLLFDQAPAAQIVRPTGMTTDDTATVAGEFPFTYSLLQRIERTLDEAHVPRFANGKRMGIMTAYQAEQLGQDKGFLALATEHKDVNPLFRSTYWKSLGAWDLFKSETLAKTVNTNSIPIHRGQFFGPGGVGGGVAEAPRVAYNTQDNYGESALIIWLMYAGFGLLDNRMLGKGHTC